MSATALRVPRAGEGGRPVVFRVNASGVHFGLFAFEYLRQYQGRWKGKPLALEPFQLETMSELLETTEEIWLDLYPADVKQALERPDVFWAQMKAWRAENVPGGTRIHREGLIGMPKKNGKSTFTSALALYLLVADGEPGAEIYSAASAKEQAKIVFRQATRMAEAGSQKLLDAIRFYRDAIELKSDGSFYKVVSADAGVQEGVNPHGVIVDEIHAHKDRTLYDTLKTATIARDEPLLVTITTAGYDLDTIGGELYERGAGRRPKIVDGQVVPRRDKERAFYFRWYQADPAKVIVKTKGDRVQIDLDEVKRANPASWLTKQRLAGEAAIPRPFGIFLRYHANIWTAVEEAWIAHGIWDSLAGWQGLRDGELAPPDRRNGEELILPGDPLVLTVDIGLQHDTSALVQLRPPRLGGKDDPEDPIAVRSDIWGRASTDPKKPAPPAHHLIPGDGPLRLELITNRILELAKTNRILAVAADPYKFETQLQELEDLGFVAVRFDQNTSHMVPASEGAFAAIHARTIAHDGDPVLAQHIENAVARDTGRGWRLDKQKAQGGTGTPRKVMDGAIGVAIGWALCQDDEIAQNRRPSISVL